MSDYNVIIPHYSVMLADGLAEIIQSRYDFKHKISMELLSAQMSDTYRVHSGDFRYYLRIPRHERFWPFTKESYQFEMSLVNFLRTSDVPVSYPIPTKQKSYLGILNAPEGIRYYSLHTEARGRVPDPRNNEDMTDLGEYLARLHQEMQTYTPSKQPMTWDFDMLISYGLKKLKQHLPNDLIDEFRYVSSKATELIAEFHQLVPQKDKKTWGIIHGNFNPKHLRIGNNQVTAFDFEYCGFGYLIFDFVYLIHHTNIRNLSNKPFQSFLEAYTTIRPLTEGELKALNTLAKLALISKMTRSVGMRDLVGVLWYDRQIRQDFEVMKKLL